MNNKPTGRELVALDVVTPGVDRLAILRHSSIPLAKIWLADGNIKPYSKAKYFTHTKACVDSLAALSELLTRLEADPFSCVIRGRYVGEEVAKSRDEEHHAGEVRRTLDSFDDQPLHAVMLDVENFHPSLSDPATDPDEAIAEFIHTKLPAEFHSAGFHWQLSNSAGHQTKLDGELRVHLWFWLDTARTSAELRAWATARGIAVDLAVFSAVQPHYTAGPIMETGMPDPIAQRRGLVDGPAVQLVINATALALVKRATPGRAQILLDAAADDPIAQRLNERGMVKSTTPEALNILCPFADGHSAESSETSTRYFLPHTGGRAAGNFKCLHASCSARHRGEFLAKLGIDEVGDAFSVVVDAATGELIEVVSELHSDDSLALRFAGEVQHLLRHTTGMGWMAMPAGATHWERDSKLLMNLSRGICRAAANAADKPHTRRALLSLRTLQAIGIIAAADPRLSLTPGAWDVDPFTLNTPGGIVCLSTGTMRPRAGDLVTRTARATPDFDAPCPHWLSFLRAVCGGDTELIEFLRCLLGYMLTGDRREQKLFFIWGSGANGKSTLGDLLLWMLDGYGHKLPAAALMATKHEGHPTELARLHGVRMALSSELEQGQYFREARVKELTGDAELTARVMHGDPFTFAMTQKHLLLGNHKPRLKGGDPAMARRMVLIPFKAAFSPGSLDPDMPAKLRAEAPAILAWMVGGAVAWFKAGRLALPAVVRAASEEYMADQNDVEKWMGDCCERGVGAGFRDKSSALYASYADWKRAHGEHAPSHSTWGERMELIPGIKKKRSAGSWYEGAKLLSGSNAAEFA